MKIFHNQPLLLFFLIAFGLAVPAFLAATPDTPVGMQILLLALGSYAPALAGVIASWIGRDEGEAAAFRQRIRTWRVGAKWYLYALLIPSLIWIPAVVLAARLGTLGQVQAAGLAFFPVIFLTNLGEEIGWRGYALPRLMQRFSPLTASLLLGVVWGAFHIPVYLQRPLVGLLSFALIVAVSVFLTWLFIGSGGSVLICTLFHAVLNTWVQVLLAGENAGALLAVTVAVLWALAGVLVARLGVGLGSIGGRDHAV